MSGSGLLGDSNEPIFGLTYEDAGVPRATRFRGGHVSAFQRGRGPGATAVGPRRGEEKKLPPKRPQSNVMELS